MKKYITLVMLLTLLVGLTAISAVAQMTGAKGWCKDQEGKPITDGVVEWTNKDNGRKMTMKTNKSGEYQGLGLTPGNYDAVLMQNGQKVDSFNNVPISMGEMLSLINIS